MSKVSEFREREAHLARRGEEASEKFLFVTKWWLDLVKGLVVLAALEYAAKRTGNRSIQLISFITFGAIVLHSMAVPLKYACSDWAGIKNEGLRFLFMIAGTVGFASAMAYLASELPDIINALIALQVK